MKRVALALGLGLLVSAWSGAALARGGHGGGGHHGGGAVHRGGAVHGGGRGYAAPGWHGGGYRGGAAWHRGYGARGYWGWRGGSRVWIGVPYGVGVAQPGWVWDGDQWVWEGSEY